MFRVSKNQTDDRFKLVSSKSFIRHRSLFRYAPLVITVPPTAQIVLVMTVIHWPNSHSNENTEKRQNKVLLSEKVHTSNLVHTVKILVASVMWCWTNISLFNLVSVLNQLLFHCHRMNSITIVYEILELLFFIQIKLSLIIRILNIL